MERALPPPPPAVVVDGEVLIGPPKTNRGRRTLPLPADVVNALRSLEAVQGRERREAGPAYVGEGYALADELGRAVHPAWSSSRFAVLANAAGRSPVRLHDLRRTSVSIKRSLGWPDHLVAAWQGHDEAVMEADGPHTHMDDLRRHAEALERGLWHLCGRSAPLVASSGGSPHIVGGQRPAAGAPGWIRTSGQQIRSLSLYPLSYGGRWPARSERPHGTAAPPPGASRRAPSARPARTPLPGRGRIGAMEPTSDAEPGAVVPAPQPGAGRSAAVAAVPETEPTAPTGPTGPVPTSPPPPRDPAEQAVLTSLERLRGDLLALDLPLPTPGADAARAARSAMVSQLDDHLLPRLRRLDAPLLAVVGGSTGAGKSTLVNSVVGHRVSESGVLRPTTRQPTLAHAPADRAWFTSLEVLPGLARTTGTAPDQRVTGGSGLFLVAEPALPPGLALLDAPDIDSVVEANRDLAGQLLGAADLWVFVTTAARYGDAVPWDVLAGAVERGTAVAIVLDRVPTDPPGVLEEVRADLVRLLTEAGLAAAPLFVLPETELHDGLLPADVVAPLRGWLGLVGSDARHRDVVVRRTLAGALSSLSARVARLADAATAQVRAVEGLRAELDEVYTDHVDALTQQLTDGTLLRGEVLARWQEFVGTGEFMRSLQSAVGRARDRITDFLRNRPPPVRRLDEALTTGVAALVVDTASDAREEALLRWRASPEGEAVLAAAPREASDPRLPARVGPEVERLVRDWQGYVLELVRETGQGKRTQARLLSLGVGGAGAVLMLVVFASTAGVTGAEFGIAGGTAVVAQRVLEAVFGEAAVRRLAAAAQADLQRRVRVLVSRERGALEQLLPDVDPALAERLRRPLDVGPFTVAPPVPGRLLAGPAASRGTLAGTDGTDGTDAGESGADGAPGAGR